MFAEIVGYYGICVVELDVYVVLGVVYVVVKIVDDDISADRLVVVDSLARTQTFQQGNNDEKATIAIFCSHNHQGFKLLKSRVIKNMIIHL